MKKLLFLLLSVLSFSAAIAQMSDQQAVKLLQQAQQQGMSEDQMVLMLQQKGVTRAQLIRINEKIGEMPATVNGQKQTSTTSTNTSIRQTPSARQSVPDKNSANLESEFFAPTQERLLPTTGNISLRLKDEKELQVIDSTKLMIDSVLRMQLDPEEKPRIFGHNFFSDKNLTFEPGFTMAAPDSYQLGPEDEVFIDIWGDSEAFVRQIISPDGNIVISELGPVFLSGLTVKEANEKLKRSYSRIYSALGEQNPTTFIKLSLGQMRSIRINVMGEVENPGTYTVSSLATLFHLLYSAGGVNEIGSLRSVSVNRGGKQIADVDVYQYILYGKNDLDISLRDGDAIIVSPYVNMVTVEGYAKRPMIYEMKDGESMAQLIEYAGGFTGKAYKNVIQVIRETGRQYQVFNVNKNDFASFHIEDGDKVTISEIIDRFENRVEVRGAVYRPGIYAIDDEVTTVRELIEKAEGLQGDAFEGRAILYREKPDYTLEVKPIDVIGLMGGTVEDIPLRNNDLLNITSIFDIRENFTISVDGEVGNPGTYLFAENMTIEDAIIQAGGMLESASSARIDVVRRVKDSYGTQETVIRSINFTMPVTRGMKLGADENFTLQPFDAVYVRTSPGYQKQQNVTIMGEVLFPGKYALSKREERLSDLVAKSGGLLSSAYPVGAQLIRKKNADEILRGKSVTQLYTRGIDSISMKLLDVQNTYSIGIELDKAIQFPGSDDDLVLQEGDRLNVPEYSSIVKISGGVVFPNAVAYKPGANLKYYISQGGGFESRARKNRVFVIYMNGKVDRSRSLSSAAVAPGCEIVVPMKPARRSDGAAEMMGIATSTTSMAVMLTTLIDRMTK